jgi:DNA-binding NarL/FixJ family response regulator
MERHSTSPADLVIADLYTLIQDGSETIRELRSRFPKVAIIAMSGRPDTGAMLSLAQNLPIVGILPKPFLTNELIAALTTALGGQPAAR